MSRRDYLKVPIAHVSLSDDAAYKVDQDFQYLFRPRIPNCAHDQYQFELPAVGTQGNDKFYLLLVKNLTMPGVVHTFLDHNLKDFQ